MNDGVVSLGVDYLTITEKNATRWNEIVQFLEGTLIRVMLAEGHTWEQAKQLGYQGSRIGTMFMGSRTDSSMLRVSGGLAEDVFTVLSEKFEDLHVTRIDLQVTIAFKGDRMLYAEECKAQVLHHQETSRNRSQPAVTLISTAGRGDTLQIGSRSSEVFCRIYDKWREQKLEYIPYTWRFEVELKGETARNVAQHLSKAEPIEQEISNMVEGTFLARGVKEPMLKGMSPHTLKGSRSKTDDQKRMKWLKQHVLPTVRRLHDHGYREELLDIFSILM